MKLIGRIKFILIIRLKLSKLKKKTDKEKHALKIKKNKQKSAKKVYLQVLVGYATLSLHKN